MTDPIVAGPAGIGEWVIYATEDGRSQICLRAEGGTVWLSQAEIAVLFQTTPQNITQHVRDIFAQGEARQEATCRPRLQVQQEGRRQVRRTIKFYSLDVIVAVACRVKSPRGTEFRQWATTHLRKYIVKGFVPADPGGRARSRCPPGAGAAAAPQNAGMPDAD